MTFLPPRDMALTDEDRARARRRGAEDAAAIAEHGVDDPPASPSSRWVWGAVMGRADADRFLFGSLKELLHEYRLGRDDYWL